MRSKFNIHSSVGSNRDHLRETMEWLCRAQDASIDEGVSAAFDIVANKWYPSYPETTGYIIPTFYDYAAYSMDPTYQERAVKMGSWLLSLQLEDGAFPGPPWIEPKGKPVVFDTGQIIQGLLRIYVETGDQAYLVAARHAGDWLVKVQESDGSWCKYDMDLPHTYNTRSAWALLCLYQLDTYNPYHQAARRNLDWVIRKQAVDGWFKNAAFEMGENPLTHTIAYTIEGLMESGKLLSNQEYIESAKRASDALLHQQAQDGSLRSRYSQGWKPASEWTCLTGNAQMAIIWFNFFQLTGDIRYFNAGIAANRFLKQVQSRFSKSLGVRGGVAGSFPIYGDYGHYLYLNWAAKFYADSLLLEEQIETVDKHAQEED